MGVRRAIDIVRVEADKRKEPIYIYGPLIHNPQVMEWLKAKNIWVLNDLKDFKSGIIVIRTHGISPQERKTIKNKGAKICDATCPRVGQIQSIIKRQKKQGYWTIIIGDKGHPEVEALLGFAGDRGFVVQGEDDIKKLPLLDKVCLVCQSTQNHQKFRQLSSKLKEKYNKCIVFNTLCNSTIMRQKETRQLAERVDAMIVVGGRNSANTRQLAAISQATGIPTFLIETEKDITPKMVNPYDTIGVTSGASTPHWIINLVIRRLKELKMRRLLTDRLIKAANFLINSHLYVALGAAFLSYASLILLGFPAQWKIILMAFSYIFSMHIINYFTDKSDLQLKQPHRLEFYIRNRKLLIALAVVSALASIIFALLQGLSSFLILSLAVMMGIIYNLRIIPHSWLKSLKFERLRDIPTSKDLAVALAWGTIMVIIPVVAQEGRLFSAAPLAVFSFIALLSYIRSAIFGIKGIQEDTIVGKETMPAVVGKEKMKIILGLLTLAMACILLLSGLMGFTTKLSYYMLLIVLYTATYLYLYHNRLIVKGIWFEAVVDGKFFLSGAIALLWVL